MHSNFPAASPGLRACLAKWMTSSRKRTLLLRQCAFGVVGLTLGHAAVAMDGTLDPTFGGLGRYIGNIAGNTNVSPPVGIVVQPDGKILLGETMLPGQNCIQAFALTRLLPDAAGLDSGFATGGLAQYCFNSLIPSGSSNNNILNAIAPTSGGGALLVGTAQVCLPQSGGCKTDVGLARINAAGALDPNFNGAGQVLIGSGAGTTFGDSNFRQGIDGAVRADGKIFVTGSIAYLGPPPLIPLGALWALQSNGTLIHEFVDSSVDYAAPAAIAIQPDGGIVVVGSFIKQNSGTTPPTTDRDCLISRYILQGSTLLKDTSFGSNGDGNVKIAFDQGGLDVNGFSYNDDICTTVAVRRDGGIVFGGRSGSDNAGGTRTITGVLTGAGQPDPLFFTRLSYFENGDKGMTSTATKVLVQADDKIVVTGFGDTTAGSNRLKDFGVIRFLPDASFDYGGFGGNTPGSTSARSMIDFSPLTGSSSDDRTYTAILSAGRILIAGGDSTYRLTRLESDEIFSDRFE